MASRQIELEFRTWGGKRGGAGRKLEGPRGHVPHRRRGRFASWRAFHVTWRLVDNWGTLRASGPYHAVRAAMGGMLRRRDFGIVHISLERDHMHLIAEAHDATALGNGMRAFQSSAARRLNRTLGRRG